MQKPIPEDVRFMYDKVYDELNRCRDWPIKILGFTSGLFIGLLGFLKLFADQVTLSYESRIGLVTGVALFGGYCVYILGKQHLEFLRYRNTQIKLQSMMKIATWRACGERTFAEKWDHTVKVKLWTRCQGWLFYALYIIGLTIFSIYIINNLQTR